MVEQKCREIDFQDAFLRKEKVMAKNRGDEKFNMKAFIKHPIVCGVILLGIGGLFSLVWMLSSMSSSIDSLAKTIDAQGARIDAVESQIIELSKEESEASGRLDGMDSQFGLLGDLLRLSPTSDAKSAITNTYNGIDAPCNNTVITLTAKSKIAYSKKIPDMGYTAEQLADQALLLPYAENGNEVYFYGQVDKAGCWDGHCIVNIYKDDKLSLITDAQYDSGKLLSCKQAFPDSSTGGQDVWVISKRVIEGDYSSGETWRFFRSGDFTKDFTIDTVEADDIMDADGFRAKIDGALEGYYHGENSNGKYNDDTGNAYLCKYFEDGTIRTLYIGKFKDGQFEDSTGNAWMVGKLDIGAKYSCYRGPFTNGYRSNDPKYWEEPLTIDRVKEIISKSGLKFNCELKWENNSV